MPDPQAVADRFAFSDASSYPTRADHRMRSDTCSTSGQSELR